MSDPESLPSVEVHSIDAGASVDLADIDTPAVINVWQTTCPPCVNEMPALQAVAAERTDISFYGLNMAETEAAVASFVDELKVEYPQLIDDRGFAAEALGIADLPTTLVIDRNGDIAVRHRGEITADGLRTALTGLDDAAAE